MTKHYGMKVTTILAAVDKLNADLDYLCAMVEQPDPEFSVMDAVTYAHALVALANQIEFIVEDISQNQLSEDATHVKLSEEDILMLNNYNDNTEESLRRLEERCGIYLQNN